MAPKVRALIIFALLIAIPLPAYAYLDPATGSMLLSGVVAFFATLGMAIQAYWHKLVSLTRRLLGRAEPRLEDDEAREG